MFKYKRLMLSLLFLLLFGITYLCADHFAAEKTLAFWYLLGGISAGEFLLAANVIFIPRSNGAQLPFRLGALSVNILYLLFTFLMIIPFCNDSLTAHGIFLWEIGGLLVALVMFCFFGFANQDVHSEDAEFRLAIAKRDFFRDELARLRFEKRKFLNGSKDAESAFIKLTDEADFAPESIAGSEGCDSEIRAGILKLEDAENADDLIRSVETLLDLFARRKQLIMRLR